MDTSLPKYLPLCQYLEQLPAEQQTERLSFAEIEALIGHTFTASTSLSSYWSGGPMAEKNWRRSGWRAKVQGPAAVLFTRISQTR
jgi:hypothetical protein